jgi:hypothetical protein
MKKILTCNTSINSAMLLRDEIEELTGKHYLVSSEAANIGQDGCLLRYGNGLGFRERYPDTEFNPKQFIELTAHKRRFSDMMKLLGILSPEFHFNGEPEQFPVLIRTTLTGSGGEGITPARNKDEFRAIIRDGDCWTPYYDVAYEVRAYVAGDKITHCYYKVPFAHQEGDKIKIRSEYHFAFSSPEGKFQKLRKAINTISEATHGKFYSVDAGWLPHRKEYVLFEGNSGSWMNKGIANALAKYLVASLQLA